jgi:hypothetical protein
MADAPKVVALRGGEIVQPGQPLPDLVALLEEVLEMARSGEIKGVALAMIHTDDCSSMRRCGVQTRGLIGCLEIMKADLCEACR